MKRIILSLFIIIIGCPSYGQMPTDGDYSNWNWEDQTQANWKSKYGNLWIEINPPFAPTTERIDNMVEVHLSGDYTKAKGWKLLWAQFDGYYPYFILYNPHKGIVRAFFYLETTPFSDVLATLSFNDVNSPSILSYGNEYQSSTEDYYGGDVSSDNDMIAVVIPNIGAETWGAVDFPILYDNYIQNIKYENKKWVFRFFGCYDYQIKLSGVQTSDTTLLRKQHTITAPKNSLSVSSFSATQAKLHKEVQSIEQFLKAMNDSVKGIDQDDPEFLKSYKSVVTGVIPSFFTLFKNISGISQGVGAVLSFFKIITGTFGESAQTTKPAATVEYMKLQGSMKLQVTLGYNTLSIPGVSGTYYPPNLLWEPFNCPMGTINLQNTPSISVTSPYEKYGYYKPGIGYGYYDGNVAYISGLDEYPLVFVNKVTLPLATNYPKKYPGKFKKYCFNEDITLAMQSLPGLALIDVHFAFVCKPNGTGDRLYKMEDKFLAAHYFYSQNGYNLVGPVPLESPVYKALIEGRFIVHKFGPSGKENYFGTPFIPMNKLKGIVFEVPEDTEVKLAVVAKFSSSFYTTPIFFKALYNVNEVQVPYTMSRVFCGQEQSKFPFGGYYNSPQYLYVNTSSTSSFSASLIELKPGFVGDPAFSAISLPLTKNLEIGNTQINIVDYYCVTEEVTRVFKDLKELFKSKSLGIEPILFPNPSNGTVLIKSDSRIINSIYIYDQQGNEIVCLPNVDTFSKELDLSYCIPGIYIVKTIIDTDVYYDNISIYKGI